ncbi:MAG: hypothetical protein CL677_06945, partial [Bdellovibrionaceae bacterium]|nr:hypothetical protein [Pseudobdellovibrionaceae bacterium]
EEAKVYASHNGEPATLLVATKKGGADTINLVGRIDSKMEIFRKKYGENFKFEVYNNEALKVKNRVAVLTSNAVSGLALVIFFLLIFLPGRLGVMASLSLPIAIIATFGFMPVFGTNLDAITILALVIAIGLLVDNSVVISENYTRLLGDGYTPRAAILQSMKTLWLPITITALTTIAAFLPMLVTKGIMGQFIKFIPIIVSTALLISLAECFFFLPTRLEGVSKAGGNKAQSDWFQRVFIPKFENIMRWTVRHRYITAAIFSGLLVLSLLMMTVGNKFMLFPPDQTEIYAARVTMPKGTQLEATDEALTHLSLKIKEEFGDKISHLVARAGVSTLGPSDPKAKEAEDVGIIIMYVNEHTRNNIPHTEMLESLRALQSPIEDVEYEAMVNGPPVGEPVNATFRSNNSESLDAVVTAIVSELNSVEGVRDAQVQDTFGDDEVYIDIDYQKADQLGLDVNTVGDAIRTAVSGKVVSDVTLNNKEVDIFVRFKSESRESVDDLKQLKVLGRDGYLIPLSAFVHFRKEPGSAHIKRFDFKRSRTITANIDSEVISAVAANARLEEKFKELKEEYKDVSIVFGGEQESTNESMESLASALVLALIGIFALLVFLLNSYLRPVIIMSTIPLGLVGFSVAFALHQRPISFLALIGVIGLAGIIVNSGIVLITFIQELLEEEKMELEEALVKASGLRLRAVVVSSLTTISGLLPTAYGIGGTDAILVPMTLAMAWGLTSGTVLTLMWVPAAYAILEDFSKLRERLFTKWFGSNLSSSGSAKNMGKVSQ